MAGVESYLLKARVGTIAALEQLIVGLNRTPGVASTRTTVALSTKWENRPHVRGGWDVLLIDVDVSRRAVAKAPLGGWSVPLGVPQVQSGGAGRQPGRLGLWVNNAGILATGAF